MGVCAYVQCWLLIWNEGLCGTERAFLVRERLDDLQMDVIVWCPYEDHKDIRPFTQQTHFSGFTRCKTDVRPYHLENVQRNFGHVHTIPS